MSGDSSWEVFMKALGKELRSEGGPLNLNKDSDLLTPNSKPLMYPGDLFDHGKQAFIFFNIRSSASGLAPANAPLGSVCLYIPSTLSVGYGANWEKVSQPFEKLVETGKTFYESLMSAYNNRDKVDFSYEGVQSMLNSLGNDRSLQYIALNVIKKTLGAEYAAEFRNKMGIAINPFAALVYDSPEFRRFNFEFEFFPKNPKEAEQVRRIIKLFKLAMHPTKTGDPGNLIWGFPCVFDIFLCTPWTDKMFMIKRSALEAADVNYAAGGFQSFFKDGHPTHTSLTLRFKELDLLTREDVEKNY